MLVLTALKKPTMLLDSLCTRVSAQMGHLLCTRTTVVRPMLVVGAVGQIQQVRWGKRQSVKLQREAKLKKLGLLPEKKKVKPSRDEKRATAARRNAVSISTLFPARKADDGLPPLPENPPDNLLLSYKYQKPVYTVPDALRMHRQMMQPAMYNNPNAPVRLRLELNMTTEKKRRYIASRRQVVNLPHMFPVTGKRFVLALAKDPVLHALATEAGAEVVGDQDLVKRIIKGTFRTDDFDYIVAHEDIMHEVVPLRGIVKAKFPTIANGCVGPDIAALIKHVLTGIEFNLEQDEVQPEFGICDTVVGTLDMTDRQLEENMECLVNEICKIRQSTQKLGHFVHRALIMLAAHGPDEYFAIDATKYVPLSSDKAATTSVDQVADEPTTETVDDDKQKAVNA